MTVEVRLFASLAESAGWRVASFDPSPATDVGSLWELLVQRNPALSRLGSRPLAACDREWVDWSHPLEGVREVAFLPPVSGG